MNFDILCTVQTLGFCDLFVGINFIAALGWFSVVGFGSIPVFCNGFEFFFRSALFCTSLIEDN